MQILTNHNKTFDTNLVSNQIDDIRFCVLDYSNQREIDYYFDPLIFLESFTSPVVELKIGSNIIQVPLDMGPQQSTCLLLAEPDGNAKSGNLEVLSITSFNERDFFAFCWNPISGFIPNFRSVEITNIYGEAKWYFPKLKAQQFLAVPLTLGSKPECCYIINEKETEKLPDILDIGKLV